jgi:hypothetical protein
MVKIIVVKYHRQSTWFKNILYNRAHSIIMHMLQTNISAGEKIQKEKERKEIS